MRAILYLSLTLFLFGCGLGPGSTMQESDTADNDKYVNTWLGDDKPIVLSSINDWSKFSFSSFAVSLPRDFRVQTLSDTQTEIELVNFVNKNVNEEYDQDDDSGRFKLDIAIEPNGQEINELMAQAVPMDYRVGGFESYKLDLHNHGNLVLVKNSTQGQIYYFNFGFDFNNNPEFEKLVLETVVFHQRGSLANGTN